jgi:hypothetical protein
MDFPLPAEYLLAWFNVVWNCVQIGLLVRIVLDLGNLCDAAREGLQLLREIRESKDEDPPLKINVPSIRRERGHE